MALCHGLVALALACTNTSNNAEPGTSPIGAAGGSGGGSPDGGPRDGGSAGDGGIVVDGSSGSRPTGYLWYASTGLGAFLRDETTSSREKGPGYVVQPSFAVKAFHDIAFDNSRNLWAIPFSTMGNQIIRLPAAGLWRGAVPPEPDLVLHSNGLQNPQSLTFDSRGRLWVLNYSAFGTSTGNVVRFDDVNTAQGTLTVNPSLTLSPGPTAKEQARFTQPTSLALDAAGSLWIAAVANVLRVDQAGILMGDVTAQPGAVLAGGEAYASLTFDAKGSLWVTAAAGGYWALRFDSPSSLKGEAAPVPGARIRLPSDATSFAAGMVVDGDGALWIAMSNQLVKYPMASSLKGDVVDKPAVSLGLVGMPDLASKLALWPPPTL